MATIQKTEFALSTPEQVRAYAQAALDTADALELEGDDRWALLPQLCALHAAKHVQFEQVASLPAFAIPQNHR